MTGTDEAPPDQPTHVRERGLGSVLGEDGDSMVRPEVHPQQRIRRAVEDVVELGPGQRAIGVPKRDRLGIFGGESLCECNHGESFEDR